ncbi:MAG: nucleotidyl transferase AbiEii/AbiGii toxin family protein [Bacilli bacterium]|nr:nucleotidyl transferase AbiEii/AbiGii toxin family protein [Bacilli bacterium]
MNWYENKKDEWIEIIDTISNELNLDSLIIEKDAVQSIFLNRLSKTDFPIVFKGGTSLSKAYKVINRFSEDLDISMSRKLTQNEKRNFFHEIIKISNDLGFELLNFDSVMSRRDFNKFIFRYESLFTNNGFKIIVEVSLFQTSYPTLTHVIHNYVTDFCCDYDYMMPFEFNGYIFDMPVQSLERTFVDKIFAICDYRLQNMAMRDSRHLYDVAKLLPLIKIDESLKEMIKNVREDRKFSKNNPSADEKYNIDEMLIEIINSRFYEEDFNMITKGLLYEKIKYDEVIENGIAKVAALKLFS